MQATNYRAILVTWVVRLLHILVVLLVYFTVMENFWLLLVLFIFSQRGSLNLYVMFMSTLRFLKKKLTFLVKMKFLHHLAAVVLPPPILLRRYPDRSSQICTRITSRQCEFSVETTEALNDKTSFKHAMNHPGWRIWFTPWEWYVDCGLFWVQASKFRLKASCQGFRARIWYRF